MNLLRAVLAELRSMFAADARLTLGTLAVVALAALLPATLWLAGAALTLGSLGVLALAVRRGARRR